MVAEADLERKVRELLQASQIETKGARYTRPAPRGYPHQWLWDSCLHAIIYDALEEREHARDELRSLFRAQQREGPDRGRLPHMILLDRDQAGALEPGGA